jgi:hypothetical protein
MWVVVLIGEKLPTFESSNIDLTPQLPEDIRTKDGD